MVVYGTASLATLHLGAYLIRQVLALYVVHTKVNLSVHHELLDDRVHSQRVLEVFKENPARLRQVDHLLFGEDATADPYANVVGVGAGEVLVAELVTLRVWPELKVFADFHIKLLKVLHEALDLILTEADHCLVVVLVARKHLHFDKVLVGAEERELLEETLPSDAGPALVLYQLSCDHGSFFELHQHHTLGRHAHIVAGIHGGESWRDDRHQGLGVGLVDQILTDIPTHLICIVCDRA